MVVLGSLTVVCGVGALQQSHVVFGGGHSKQSLEVVSAGEEQAGVVADFQT